MAQLRNCEVALTFGDSISEVELQMSERVESQDVTFFPRIETQDFVIPIDVPPVRYKFDTTLVRWDTTLITFDYE
jgi:hypothetical protein